MVVPSGASIWPTKASPFSTVTCPPPGIFKVASRKMFLEAEGIFFFFIIAHFLLFSYSATMAIPMSL